MELRKEVQPIRSAATKLTELRNSALVKPFGQIRQLSRRQQRHVKAFVNRGVKPEILAKEQFMASPASVKKHPVHPMVVALPIGLWVFAMVCDVAHAVGGRAPWRTVAIYCV